MSVFVFKVKLSDLLSAASHALADRGLVLSFSDLMGQIGRWASLFVFKAIYTGTWSVLAHVSWARILFLFFRGEKKNEVSLSPLLLDIILI